LYKGLSFPHDFLQINEDRFAEAKKAWRHMLGHQIAHLDSIEGYLAKYRTIAEWLKSPQTNSASQIEISP
jgi:hypothetical protein